MGLDNISTLSFPISSVNLSQQMGISKSSGRETGSPPIRREEMEGRIKRSQSEFVELQKVNDNINDLAKIQKAFGKRFEKVDRLSRTNERTVGTDYQTISPLSSGKRRSGSGSSSLQFFPQNDRSAHPPSTGGSLDEIDRTTCAYLQTKMFRKSYSVAI